MKKFFRRSLACIIAVVMIATSLPFSAITANADTVAGDKVLFAYFCGDDEGTTAINQKIRFAVSEDGINFSPLNGNLPILSNEEDENGICFNNEWGKYSHTGGARDPFIFNKRNADGSIADGYYIVATDLCVNSNSNSYNNTKILVWDVPSLDRLDSVTCTVIDTAGMYTTDVKDNNDAIAWAPEIVWDYQVQKYALVWSACLWSSAKIHVAYTSDFKTFTTRAGNTIDGVNNFAEVLYTRDGYNFIDANINYENGKYYMVIKRENGGNGNKGVLYSVSANTLDGLNAVDPIRFYDSVNTGDPNGLEGPEVYLRPDGHWVLIADEYVKNPVCSFAMYDLGTSLEQGLIAKGADYDHRQDLVTSNINSVKPRHGGIARISNTDYEKLNSTYAGYNETSPGELVAKYFTTSGDVTADATGHGYTLANNGVTMTTKDGKVCAYFNNSGKSSNDASAQYAKLELSTTLMNLYLSSKKGVTFTWNAYDLGNSGSYEEYANMFNLSKYKGNPGTLTYDGTNWTHNQYKLSYLTSQLSSGISNGTQTSAGVQRMDVKSPALNAWHSYKVVYGLNGMQVYRDNSLVKSYALDGINDSWINDVFSNGRLVFGASLFGTDMLFNGYINDFRIYSTSNAQNIRKINNPNPTSSLKTLYNDRYGLVTNGSDPRIKNNNTQFQIVNDAKQNNTNAGILHFDLSQFAKADIGEVDFNVTLDSLTGDSEITYMNFYYATSISNTAWLNNAETRGVGLGYGSGTTGVNAYLSGLGYNAAKEHGLLAQFNMKAGVTTNTFDAPEISETIRNLIKKGHKDLYIIIMHEKAGGSDATSGWSDALISPSKVYFSVNYTPFDNTTLVGNKTYIDKNIDNWSTSGSSLPNNKVIYNANGSSTEVGINNNVLYSSNVRNDPNAYTEFSMNEKLDDSKMNVKMMSASGRIVYMYTGDKTVAKVPLIVEYNKPSTVLQRLRLNYLISANSDWTFNDNIWYRSTEWYTWDIKSGADADGLRDGTHEIYSDSSHNAKDFANNDNKGGFDGTVDFHNIATYNGDVSFPNGYMKLPNPQVDMSLDGFCYWTSGFWGTTPNYSYQNNITKNSTGLAKAVPTLSLPSTASYYLLDCRDIMEMYTRVKQEYEYIKSEEDKCTEDSVLAYYQAVSNLVGFKLDSYDLSTDANLQTCASDISNVVSAYNTAYNNIKHIVTLYYGDGRVQTTYMKKGDKITLTGDAFLLTKSPTVSNGNGQHRVYDFRGSEFDGDGITIDGSQYEFYEPYTLVDCSGGTATCVKKAVCAVCKAEYGTVDSNNHVNKTHYDEVPATCTTGGHSAYDVCDDCHTEIGKTEYDALGHNYEYTYNNYSTHTKKCSRGDIEAVEEPHTNDGTGNCSLCLGSLLDKTALNAAIATAKPIYDPNNTDGTYVTESFNEFKAVYEGVVAANPTTQEEVNSLTAELTTATNTLRKTTLTVQFDKKVDKDVTESKTESYSYGEVKEFEVTDGDVEKWEIVTDNGTDQPVTTTYIKTGENTISLVITRNVQVTAYISKNGTTQQNITKVVFRGRNNAVVAIKYIEAGDSLATSDVPIPAIPFYSATSWDKTVVDGLDNGGVITVRAQYTFDGQEVDKCGIHFTSFDGGVKKFNYDSLVKLNFNSSGYFGMYSEPVDNVNSEEAKTKLLTYFETDEFYAPHNSNIYVYELNSKPTTATVGVTGSYSRTDATTGRKYAVFNCKFYVPDEATVLEWGIKATAGGQKITFKSDTKSRRNEYSFRINFPQNTSMTSVDAQAYIIYETVKDDKVVKETVLSKNTVTQDF